MSVETGALDGTVVGLEGGSEDVLGFVEAGDGRDAVGGDSGR